MTNTFWKTGMSRETKWCGNKEMQTTYCNNLNDAHDKWINKIMSTYKQSKKIYKVPGIRVGIAKGVE